jgi:hypothetical protein
MLFPSEITAPIQLRSCILDPCLALSAYGVSLVKQLREVMELWVVRELWQILDNSHLYLQKPELITLPDMKISEGGYPNFEEICGSLQEWENFRLETDLAKLNLFWFGDSPRESFLPKTKNLAMFWHWESLVQSLDDRIIDSQTIDALLPLAFRDSVALAASLGSAFILTRQNASNSPPEICQSLENWRIPCEMLPPNDSVVTIERDYLRQLFVYTGLTRLLWAEIHLCVLHLVASELSFSRNPWSGVRGFWYVI